jgi:hypothetical protein
MVYLAGDPQSLGCGPRKLDRDTVLGMPNHAALRPSDTDPFADCGLHIELEGGAAQERLTTLQSKIWPLPSVI